MADLFKPGKGPGGKGEEPVQAEEAKPVETPEYVTKEYAAMLEKRLYDQGKKLEEVLRATKPTAAPKEDSEEKKTLTEQMKELAAWKAEVKDEAAITAIAAEVTHNGVSAEAARGIAEFIKFNLGSRIEATRGRVVVKDGEGELAISDYVKLALQSQYKHFLPPKSPPMDRASARGQAQTPPDVMEISYADYVKGGKAITDLVKSGKPFKILTPGE
jgi:hypothetical protein